MEGRGFQQGEWGGGDEVAARPAGQERRPQLSPESPGRHRHFSAAVLPSTPPTPLVLPPFPSLLPFAASLIFFFLICLHHSIPLLTQKVNLSETGIFSHAAPTPRRSLSLPPNPPVFFSFLFFSLSFFFFFTPLSPPPPIEQRRFGGWGGVMG